MDIAGAKALKQRLGPNAADLGLREAPGHAEVPADAPPVYHWTGVSKPATAASTSNEDDEPEANVVSLFGRLGLSFR